jgi:hypothetical protein
LVLTNSAVQWWNPGRIVLYRQLPHSAFWSPVSPYPSDAGRFDNGKRLNLYTAGQPEGAVAEYFRRRPELLAYQDRSRIRVFRVTLEFTKPCLDVRTETGAAAAGIAFDRLISADPDPKLRYQECRRLADATEADGSAGIAYPSAALIGSHAWNVVAFGSDGDLWRSLQYDEVPRPWVDPALVVAVPPGT